MNKIATAAALAAGITAGSAQAATSDIVDTAVAAG